MRCNNTRLAVLLYLIIRVDFGDETFHFRQLGTKRYGELTAAAPPVLISTVVPNLEWIQANQGEKLLAARPVPPVHVLMSGRQLRH